jgi:hypothetical protein
MMVLPKPLPSLKVCFRQLVTGSETSSATSNTFHQSVWAALSQQTELALLRVRSFLVATALEAIELTFEPFRTRGILTLQ